MKKIFFKSLKYIFIVGFIIFSLRTIFGVIRGDNDPWSFSQTIVLFEKAFGDIGVDISNWFGAMSTAFTDGNVFQVLGAIFKVLITPLMFVYSLVSRMIIFIGGFLGWA